MATKRRILLEILEKNKFNGCLINMAPESEIVIIRMVSLKVNQGKVN